MVLRADEYDRVLLAVLVHHGEVPRHLRDPLLARVRDAEHSLLLQAQRRQNPHRRAHHDGRGEQRVRHKDVLRSGHSIVEFGSNYRVTHQDG